MEEQVARLVAGIRDALGEELVGIYLHGSAVLGGLRPRSDLDVLAVAERRTTIEERRRLADVALAVSGDPRPVELDVVVQSEIRPWRRPARTDFHYFELHRAEWEGGNLEPWSDHANVNLASTITMTLAGNRTLYGPPPAAVFDPVPRDDYVDSVLGYLDEVDQDVEWDTRNVILTLARIWSAVATEDVHSKGSAAEWALRRLPEEHRPVLELALAVYRGEAEEPGWNELCPQVQAYVDHVRARIDDDRAVRA